MTSVEETVADVTSAAQWDQRVARIRLIPQRHGTAEHAAIYAAIARAVYVPHLAPDFAYIHAAPFYEPDYFEAVYEVALALTDGFTKTNAEELASVLLGDPRTLLVFRTILGLTKDEFAHSTMLVAEPFGRPGISSSKVDGMERKGTAISHDQARDIAETLAQVMAGTLFGDPPGSLKSKQDKPDTADGWPTVRHLAAGGVPCGLSSSTALRRRIPSDPGCDVKLAGGPH